jgi:hypothetical protein
MRPGRRPSDDLQTRDADNKVPKNREKSIYSAVSDEGHREAIRERF